MSAGGKGTETDMYLFLQKTTDPLKIIKTVY